MSVRWIDGSPGLIVEEGGRRYLVLSDLHLGIEDEGRDRGIHLPSMLPSILESVKGLLNNFGPVSLVLLGDVKHRIVGVSWREARQVREFVMEVRPLVEELIIAPGNHDVGIYSLTESFASIMPSRGFGIGDKWLLHGHTWPHPEALSRDLIIIGHTHPVLRLVEDDLPTRQRVYLFMKSRRSRLYDALETRPGYGELVKSYGRRGNMKLLVMPHFNPAAGGVEVEQLIHSKMGSPLLRSGVFDVKNALVLSLEGVILKSTQENSSGRG
ncbi:MAG: metallophosphoesterase [Nitrososphaerota archaeon]